MIVQYVNTSLSRNLLHIGTYPSVFQLLSLKLQEYVIYFKDSSINVSINIFYIRKSKKERKKERKKEKEKEEIFILSLYLLLGAS